MTELIATATTALTAQGLPAAQIQALSQAFDALVPRQVTDVKNVMRALDLETLEFTQVDDAFDVDPMKPTITQTIELGYKGTLFNKLLIGVDAYHTKIRDFVGPVTTETPNVFLDPATLGAFLGRQFGAALDNPQNAILNGALVALLDNNPQVRRQWQRLRSRRIDRTLRHEWSGNTVRHGLPRKRLTTP